MLGRKTILVLFSKAIMLLFNGIVYLIAVNIFLPEQFGNQKIILSIMGIFVYLTHLGLNTPYLIIMAEIDDPEKNDAYTTFFVIKFILIFLSSILITIYFIHQILKGKIPNTTDVKLMFFLLYLQNLFNVFSSIYEYSYKSQLNVAKTEIPQIFGSIIQLILSLLSVLIFENFIAYIASLIILPFTKLLFFIKFNNRFNFSKFRVYFFKRYIKLGKYYFLILLLYSLTVNLGPIISLKYLNSNLLGVYAVISSFFTLILSLQQTIESLLLSNFSLLIKKKKTIEIKKTINLFEKYTAILNGIFIFGLILFSKIILKNVMGEIYYEKGLFLYFGFMIAIMDLSIFKPYRLLLMANDDLSMILLLNSIRFILSIVSWYLLIPLIGINAMELGSWLYIIFFTIIVRIYCKEKIGIGEIPLKQLLNLVFLMFFFMLNIYIALFMPNINLIIRIMTYFLISLVYIFLLIITKIVTKSDLVFLIDILNLKKMYNYIVKDI